jgi:amino acid adenylation domain-containing protein/non-ribosomal peptide synthase protein (TIGR01720 family)
MSDAPPLHRALSPSDKRALLAQLLRRKLSEVRTRPVSFAQERLWFLYQLSPHSPFYNVSFALRLSGVLDVPALQVSLNEIVRRHESLRTTFAVSAGQPVQVIAPAQPVLLPITDLHHLPDAPRQAEACRLATVEAQRPFDLEQGPLLRLGLLRLAAQEHVLLLTMHHIITDGWSLGVFVRELGALYSASIAGRSAPLSPLPLQYADYAVWQRQWLQGELLERQLAFWNKQLAGVPVLALPTDRPRPATQNYRGAGHSVLIQKEISDGVQALCRGEGVTPFMLLLAAFQVLLARTSGQDDIAVGTPLANRSRAELEGLIGFFVNTLVLRTDLSGNPPFRTLLQRLRETALGAYAHPDVPFEKLVAELRPQRDPSHNPLFQVMFALQNMPLARLDLPGLTISRLETEEISSTFDLSLSLRETPQGLAGWCEYDTDLFDKPTIVRMLGHYERLLEGIVANPARRIRDLPLLTEPERRQLLVEWNRTERDYPRDRCLHQLITEQAVRTPDAIAAIAAGRHITYQELEGRANQLARHLRRAGVRPEACIGVCLERSPESLVALLAVLKSGGAYLPLDPSYPRDRFAALLQDARSPVVLTTQDLRSKLPMDGLRVICLDTEWEQVSLEPAATPEASVELDQLAYVIYTSGSTGKPKGVAVTHRAAISHFTTFAQEFGFRTDDRVFQFSSMAVDFSLEEVFPTLLTGATLVFRGPDLWTPAEFLHQVRSLGITRLDLPTAYWHPLARQLGEDGNGWEESRRALDAQLRSVVIGGETASPEAVHLWQRAGLRSVRLFNSYGPTEATVTATTYDIPPHPDGLSRSRVPIGRPLPNRCVYVLDRYGQPTAIGVPGELYLGGAGLARGYLHATDQTAERFVPDPFGGEPGARLYRTGDLVRWLLDGNLEFLGRLDHQIKVRGFRVEPGEIEAALRKHPGIRLAHVAACDDPQGNKRLVAFLVPTQSQPGRNGRTQLASRELRAHLRERLPEHMIPASFVSMQALPTLPNGKVDVRSLPEPDWGGVQRNSKCTAPHTDAERRLAEIWSAVLGVERVGIHDNFFELGGDSILSIQVIARAKQAGLHLTPRQMFQHQTIAELAAVAGVRGTCLRVEPGGSPEPTTGPIPVTPIQRWFFEQESPEPHYYNMAVILQVQPEVDAELLGRAFYEVVAQHEALHLCFIREEGRWQQRVGEVEGSAAFARIDLSAIPAAEQPAAIEAQATKLQSSLNLAAGPLTRGALFELGQGQSGRLVWVIHHLAMDGVSWRILFTDLQTVYRQLRAGEPPSSAQRLATPTTPFSHWARRLAEHAASPKLQQEAAYWLHEARQTIKPLPVDQRGHAVTMASADSVVVSLTEAETHSLLQELPKAYRAQINDLLLTALAQAVTAWTGDPRLLVDLEGHGREELFDDLDLSRSVGWFTSVFPVLIDLEKAHRPDQQLRAIKEQLRRVPERGVGYGLLRYLGPDKAVADRLRGLPPAELCFNYLGQFDQVMSEDALFSPAKEPIGPTQSPGGRLAYLLEINAWVSQGRFHADWTYSTALHHRATVQRLADKFRDGLRTLIEHSCSPQASTYTPSDFPEANLNQAELDRLLTALQKPPGGAS